MRKSIMIIILISCLVGCSASSNFNEVVIDDGSEWGNTLHRVENNEVICYIHKFDYSGGLQCKWK